MKNLNYKGDFDTHGGYTKIMGFEPYFNEMVWVGTIDHDKKEIKPTHGYFAPHLYGKRMRAKARSMGYKYTQK